MAETDEHAEPSMKSGEHPRLRVGGFEPLTTVEWEGRLSAVVFLQGCPWRCRYCHNAELTPLTAPGMRPWAEIYEQLHARRGFIDAVIFSGGEPTAQSELPEALRETAELGFQVGLETNGFNPETLAAVLDTGVVDLVSMDIKAPFSAYEMITQIPATGSAARESAALVVASGIAYEFRTTWHPALLTQDDLRRIARDLVQQGAGRWVVQMFRREGCPVRWLRESTALPAHLPSSLRDELAALIDDFEVRGEDG